MDLPRGLYNRLCELKPKNSSRPLNQARSQSVNDQKEWCTNYTPFVLLLYTGSAELAVLKLTLRRSNTSMIQSRNSSFACHVRPGAGQKRGFWKLAQIDFLNACTLRAC